MAEDRPEAQAPNGHDQDTFPKLMLRNARERGDQPAMREKDLGIWQAWTWSEVEQEVRRLACGLAALGLRRGDKIAIIGDNRPRLYWTMVAAQSIGAIPVPIYQDSVAEETAFVLGHAEARFALVEDQEQVDKLLEVKEKNPGLEKIIYDDSRGLRHYQQDFLTAYDELLARGDDHSRAHPDFFASEVAKGKAQDVSIILYTSGTTGQPKGVVLSFDNVIRTAQNAVDFDGLRADEEMLAYLPMAWVGDHIFSYGQSYCAGFCVSCPESSATVMHDLWELGPTFFFAPPRIFENILTTVMIRMEDASWIKRKLFHYFMGLARRVGPQLLDGQPVATQDRLLYKLGEVLIYGPLKNTLGFSRIRIAYTAGEAIGPDIFQFYRSLGINLKQLYGMTEASVFVTLQPDGEIRADTVGRPAPDVEIKLAEDGEVLFRSPGVFQEYFKNPEATAEAKTAEGWVHTGDAGLFTEEGHLRIIDRAKDVGRLRDGSLFAPKYLENKLKFFPEVKEAVTFGHERDYVTAFINIDLEAVGSWAERNNVPYASYQELAANERVYETIKAHVDQVNQDLAAEPQLAGTQIRRFLILHKELDPDDGELTRTRKVRRRIIADRYEPLIDALYAGADHAFIETQVTFEDGRTGKLSADLRIEEAQTYPATKMAS